MYLYVDRQKGLDPVPAPLLERFGTLKSGYASDADGRSQTRAYRRRMCSLQSNRRVLSSNAATAGCWEMQRVVIAREQRPTVGVARMGSTELS